VSRAPHDEAESHGLRVGLGPHLLALAIGLSVGLALLGGDTLTSAAPFLATPIGDFAAEQASYLLVANDIWRFPFLSLPLVNRPEGANAVFFGGIPLLAMTARMVADVTGSVPNLIGFWYFLCFALQGHSFFFLMRQITRERPFVVAACSLAAVLAYAFLTRFGHVSLFGQFLVIYAMGLAVRATQAETDWRTILLWMTALAAAALLVFAYLAVSVAMLFGAVLVLMWWQRRMRAVEVFGAGLAFTAVLGFVAWSAGYFWAASVAEPTDMSSYSQLGLNLGGLVIPPQSVLFPSQPLFRPWWEGDFYLGVGTVALLATVLIARRRAVAIGLARVWPVAAILLILTVYALSNRWAFGSYVLLEYDLPGWALPVVGLARSGGRLFWPIGYLLMACAFALAIGYFGRRGVALAAGALVLLTLEASSTLAYVHGLVHEPAKVPLDYAGLQAVMDAHSYLRLYPSFWCNPGGDGSTRRVVHWQLQSTSARAGQASNSAITVRKMKDCVAEWERMPSEVLRPGEINVFLDRGAFRTAFAGRGIGERGHCRAFDMPPGRGYMCSRAWDAETELPLPELRPIDEKPPLLAPGSPVDFSTGGNWELFAGGGWWLNSDGEFTWTDGDIATIDLMVPRDEAGATLIYEVYPYLATRLPNRTVEVRVEGRTLALWRFDSPEWSERQVDLPTDLTGRPITIELHQSVAQSPRELGIGADPRRLGIAVKTITTDARKD
jgi:hypothetical protein